MADAADDVHAPAAAGGANRRPPPLSMSFASETGHARRQSTMSSASSNSDDVEAYSALSALDSSAALILVHDQDELASPLDFTEEDEDDLIDDDELVSPMFEVRKSVAFQSLSPSLVFLFLLAPFLKLSALNLSNTQLPLKYGLPALLLSALASAFARQIWYMLARYVRKADMTDILLDTFAKGRGKERQRTVIRNVIRVCNGFINLLLAVTYLRFSIYTLHPLLSEKHHPVISYVVATLGAGVLVAYLSFARSLSSRRVAYTSWLSISTYLAWLGCTIYAHKNGLLEVEPGLLGYGSIWQGIATTAFAFCSSSTLPLYASLKSHPHPISTNKPPRSRSFRLLSFSSVIIAVLLLLPSVIFSAFPNQPATSSLSFAQQTTPIPVENSTSTVLTSMTSSPPHHLPSSTPVPLLLNSTHVLPVLNSVPALAPPLPSDITLPKIQIQTVRRLLSAAALLLGIPPVILTTPSLPLPALRSASVQFNVNRVCTISIVLLLALIPPRTFPGTGKEKNEQENFYLFSSGVFALLTLLMLFMTLLGTYTVPAVVHILIHFFKRPIAIVVPPRTPLLQTTSTSADFGAGAGTHDNDDNDAQPSSRHSSPRSVYDELLLRKERALQKKQFRKRIVWDIGVWLLLGASLLVVGGFARTISIGLS